MVFSSSQGSQARLLDGIEWRLQLLHTVHVQDLVIHVLLALGWAACKQLEAILSVPQLESFGNLTRSAINTGPCLPLAGILQTLEGLGFRG